MKNKELIRQLQKADPSGEMEVSVGNHDIYFLIVEEAYWDGNQQVLIRDEKHEIVGAKYRSGGHKLVINTMSVTDILWDNPEAVIDYSELEQRQPSAAVRYKEQDKETRKKVRKENL